MTDESAEAPIPLLTAEYSEVEVQKCEDFYWKQCKIVFKERTFDATSRDPIQ